MSNNKKTSKKAQEIKSLQDLGKVAQVPKKAVSTCREIKNVQVIAVNDDRLFCMHPDDPKPFVVLNLTQEELNEFKPGDLLTIRRTDAARGGVWNNYTPGTRVPDPTPQLPEELEDFDDGALELPWKAFCRYLLDNGIDQKDLQKLPKMELKDMLTELDTMCDLIDHTMVGISRANGKPIFRIHKNKSTAASPEVSEEQIEETCEEVEELELEAVSVKK